MSHVNTEQFFHPLLECYLVHNLEAMSLNLLKSVRNFTQYQVSNHEIFEL